MRKVLTLILFFITMLCISSVAYAAEVNLSVNKPYTNVRVVSPQFPDTDNKELTDGVLGTMRFVADSAWTGASYRATESGMIYDEWPLYTTVIDLEEVSTVTKVYGNFIRHMNTRVGLPISVKVYASVDNINWMKLGYTNAIFDHIPDGIYSIGWHIDNIPENESIDLVGNSPVKARYIRFDFETRSDMHLIDEITVMGYKGVTADAVTPFNTRKLENDTIMRADDVTDLVLINFNPQKSWNKESLKPYIAYIDAEGNTVDTLFDTVCFVANSGPNGRVFDVENNLVTIDDWKWYINSIFNGYMDILDETAKEVAVELQRDYKLNLVLMMPYPPAQATSFGTLDGKALDLSVEADWKYAVEWYLNEVVSQVNGYDYIDFKGFYWINEYPNSQERMIYTNHLLDEMGYKSYWIPYFHSRGYLWNETLGFDGITLQPNHFFSSSTENTLGNGGTKIVETVARLGAYADIGVEFEMDLRLDSDKDAYNRFLDYLNTADKMGYQGEGYFRNWYEGGGGVLGLAQSRAPELRLLYDNIYELIKGNYKSREYIDKLNDNILLGKSYTHNVSNWYADRSDDSNCVYLTDGQVLGNFYGNDYFGAEKQDAVIQFEFAETVFREFHIVAFKDLNAGVNLPKNIKISAKTGDEWETLYDGAFPDSTRAVIRLSDEVKASGLKFEFIRDGGFLFLKEIMAYKDENAVKCDVEIDNLLYGDVTFDGVINNMDVIQINRKNANLSSVFDIAENLEKRLKVANVTRTDDIINNLDVIHINRKNANLSSVFDKRS